MPAATRTVRHRFLGGWGPDFGPTVDVIADVDALSGANVIAIPFLVRAKNHIYELDGGPHKIGGSTKLSALLEAGATIHGIFDFWRQGAGGSPSQRRVIHIADEVYKDDGDGAFVSIASGLEVGKIPDYTTFDDELIWASDSTIDVPRVYDGTAVSVLGTNTPSFAFSETHKNRLWAAGDAANPSRLYFSPDLSNGGPGGDWNGATSGEIDIDPGDGDRITALVSHKNELIVFKGPYRGSIHRVTGSAPTGSDPFARQNFIRGLGAVSHRTVFRFGDDVGFLWSDGTFRSLSATAAYGDYSELALSRPLNAWLQANVSNDRLKFAQVAVLPAISLMACTITVEGASQNNRILFMDYRFQPARWSYAEDYVDCASLATVIDSDRNDTPTLMCGGYDGFVRKLLQSDRSVDAGTPIAMSALTPFLNYGDPSKMKELRWAAIGMSPRGNFEAVFGWQRDNEPQATVRLDQGGGDVLAGPGVTANIFTLDSSPLGGASFLDRYVALDEGGEFRSIQFELANSNDLEDFEIHSLSVGIGVGAVSLEND